MATIQFVFINIEAEPYLYDYNAQTTQADLYSVLSNYLGSAYQAALSYDQTSPFNCDNTPLLSIFGQPMNAQVFVQVSQAQASSLVSIQAYMDGQPIQVVDVSDSMMIGEFVAQVQQICQDPSSIASVELYDQSNQPITNQADQNQPFSAYTQGYQQIIMNLVRGQAPMAAQMYQQPQQIPQQQSSPGKKQNSANDPQSLLSTLVLLKNISILFDVSEQFVVYKFHFPVLVQGYLRQSTAKEPKKISQFNPQKLDWVDKKNIRYACFDDFGFAIAWPDGNISFIKVKQQQ